MVRVSPVGTYIVKKGHKRFLNVAIESRCLYASSFSISIGKVLIKEHATHNHSRNKPITASLFILKCKNGVSTLARLYV